MKLRGLVPRTWRWLKKAFLFLFIFQLFYIFLLKWVDPPFTITQMHVLIKSMGADYSFKRDYVNRKNVSVHARLAVIASEDQLFPTHGGFDWKSIEIALEKNQQRKRKMGASTISQQVAKNVFLWQGRSWFRKGLEVYFTKMIEWIWGKKRILDVYLNVIEMGEGIFGIEAASRAYFNKPAAKLTRKEAAAIAACLPSPVRFKVVPPSAYITRRTNEIMRQMNNLKSDEAIIEVIQ